MKIKKIEIANILSFGHKQVIDNISQFNLFIGKNGSGKTNTLKIIGDLSIDFDLIEENTPVWTAKIPSEYQNRNIKEFTLGSFGDLTIEFDNEAIYKKIIFQNANHIQGEYNRLKNQIIYIDKPISDSKYYEIFLKKFQDIGHMKNDPDMQYLALLNFGLSYIFDDRFSIGDNSCLHAFDTERNNKQRWSSGGIVAFLPEKWSSGTLHIAKIIQQVILSRPILLIDEIEQHLEPRICRKLIQYIFWLCSYGNKKLKTNNETLNSISKKWDAWNPGAFGTKKFDKKKNCASFEENGIGERQLFISTHSSVLIQEFLSLGASASIYEFDLKWIDTSINQNSPNILWDEYLQKEAIEGIVSRKTLFTSVRHIDSNANNILDNLGAKGSDLLQTNGVIWVEGPSDVIYIKKWLEMYAYENHKSSLQQGRDYEFQMFGGTLLDSLCLIHEGEVAEESYKKLVSMFSFSRNAFVVIDSDAIKKSDGAIVDKSNFFKAKKYIKKQFELLKESREGLGLWYEEGNTKIRTMESYLDNTSRAFIKPSWTKKIAAQKVTENWTEDKKLSDFKGDLNGEIEKLYDVIAIWKNS